MFAVFNKFSSKMHYFPFAQNIYMMKILAWLHEYTKDDDAVSNNLDNHRIWEALHYSDVRSARRDADISRLIKRLEKEAWEGSGVGKEEGKAY